MTDQDNISAEVAPDGPFKTVLKFGIRTAVDDEGEYMHGYADVELPPGVVPTDENVNEIAVRALGQLPDGFRFMTRKEFTQELAREMTGIDLDVAVPHAHLSFRLDAFK